MKGDPKTITLQFDTGPKEVPIIRMVTLQGVREFALHEDPGFPAPPYIVSHIGTGGGIAKGLTGRSAISLAAAEAAKQAEKHGSLEAAIKIATIALKRKIRRRERKKA